LSQKVARFNKRSVSCYTMEKPSWVKDKTLAKDFETIEASRWDDYKDFQLDDGCYVLIKVLWDSHQISVAICDYKHTLLKEFRGTRAQDIWSAIFSYEQKNKLAWFKRKDHIAYLGKELKKAEIARALGYEYVQE